MDSYKSFAGVYDILMQDVDYKGWAKYLQKIWKHYKKIPGIVVDLGCGTGTLSILLSKKGYEMIGIDNSSEMLSIAANKAKNSKQDILFLNQPMESFELYGTVDCIISVFDSINYIIDKDGLFETFRLAKNYLNEGGLFVFDINTPYKYKNILSHNTFAESFPGCSYIWENYYDSKKKINEYVLNLFIERVDGLYEKTCEYHYQKAYSENKIKAMLKEVGFSVLDTFDAYTFRAPKKNSERIFFVARVC